MRWPLPALVLLSTLLEGSEAFSVAVFANPSVFTYAGVQESQALHSCPLKSPLAHRSICPRRPEGVTQSRGSLAKNAAKLRMSTSDNELTTVLSTAIKAGRAAGELMKEKLGADVIKTKWNARDLLTEIDPMCQQIISDIVLAEHPSHAFLGEESVDAGAEASGKATNDLKDSEWLWVVDPIDGTTNFVSGMPLSAVSIGVARRGELVVGVIVDPFRDEVFSAALGKGAFMNGEAIRVGEESDIGDAVIAAGSPPNMRSITPSIRGVSALMPKCRTIRMIGSAALHFAWIANGRLTAYWEADLNSWDTAAGAVLVSEAGGEITDLRGDAFGLTTRPVLASNGRTHAAILAVLTEAQVFGLDPP